MFTFVDLFSGIGGFHIGLERLGGKCLLACDIEPIARETYFLNFNMMPCGDIYDLKTECMPDFDVLCAGFPCQAFSNIGPKGGFNDPRGAVFFEIVRILKDKKPKTFILENVKGLLNHDNGRTYKIIIDSLSECGYNVRSAVLEAKDFGLPQLRKRLFIVGILNGLGNEFVFPKPQGCNNKLSDILGGKTEREYAFTIRIGGRKSGINNRFNWDAYYVDGNVKHINVEQCLALQGFPKGFTLAGNKDHRFKQVGNAVPTTIVEALGKQLIELGVL